MSLRPRDRLNAPSPRELIQLAGERFSYAGTLLRRLRPVDMTRIIIGIEVALTVAFAIAAGTLVWKAFEPPAWAAAGDFRPGSPTRRTALPVVLTEVDAFHRASTAIGPGAGVAAAPETMLNLQLFGIRAGTNNSPGSAIIATPDNAQDVFTDGQEIMPGVRVERILPDRVVIRRNGVIETLSFDRQGPLQQATLAVPMAPGAMSAPLAARTLKVDAASLGSLIRFSRIDRGLIVQGSDDPELLELAGLEVGDLLMSVNGAPVGDVGALAAFSVTKLSSLDLEIERKGQRNIHRLSIDRKQ